jgi:threonine dehydratase
LRIAECGLWIADSDCGLPVTLADIERARSRLARHLRITPLLESAWLSGIVHSDVRLKLESMQVSNSFKVRGALNALARLREDGRHGSRVVTASAGNHGRAIAWAAALTSFRATVFTPRTAPAAKLDAIRASGADLRAECDDYEDAERRALEFAQVETATFISPYNHEDVIAGAGTLALEIVEAWPEVDTVVVPIGGGGLISGIAIAIKATRASVEVIGVEAEASQAFTAARNAGRIVRIDVKPTIADGLGGNVESGTLTWPYIRDLVDRIVTVSEDELRASIRGLVAQEHLVAEGAGAAGVAAIVSTRAGIDGRRTAVVLSGANIDLATLVDVVAHDSGGR